MAKRYGIEILRTTDVRRLARRAGIGVRVASPGAKFFVRTNGGSPDAVFLTFNDSLQAHPPYEYIPADKWLRGVQHLFAQHLHRHRG